MRIFIERQGKAGQRKMSRVRNRFCGHDCEHNTEGRLRRQFVMQRDERRIGSLDEGEFDLTGAGVQHYSTGGTKRTLCPTTGVVIPAGGGKVRLDECGSGRRPTLYFAPTGNLVAAHF